MKECDAVNEGMPRRSNGSKGTRRERLGKDEGGQAVGVWKIWPIDTTLLFFLRFLLRYRPRMPAYFICADLTWLFTDD